ncbi:MAG TPA: hypothetical protein DDW20_03540 [Firmicutes bacterium]|nr:hypothetical protein [Bacillota bacterium]
MKKRYVITLFVLVMILFGLNFLRIRSDYYKEVKIYNDGTHEIDNGNWCNESHYVDNFGIEKVILKCDKCDGYTIIRKSTYDNVK